ncbi:MAG: hypothetical protein U5K72_03585 [Balneolaceae bacterium]|nr:hypothetical protein [Balneolaceae bacterium]
MNYYYEHLSRLADDFDVQIPVVPDYATNNGHLFTWFVHRRKKDPD